MATKIQIRRGISASWDTVNPILSSGEVGFETDSYKFKIGDGSSRWTQLDYFSGEDFIVSASANALALATSYADSASASIINYIDNLTTIDIEESFNLYFTEERSLNTASTALVHNNHTNLTAVFVDDEIRFTASGGGNGGGGGSGSVDLSGNVEIGQDLQVGQDLLVLGSGSVVGNVGFGNDLEVQNNISAGSNILVNNDLNVFNDINVQNNISANTIYSNNNIVGHVDIKTPTLSSNAYTITESDDGCFILMDNDSTANTLRVPTDATYNFPIGTQITVVQSNIGQTTIAAVTPATTTINFTPGNKLRARWSSATLTKTASNIWILIGDLTL